MAWLFVPESEGWSWDSTSPFRTIERSATWKGKPLRPQQWSRAWQTAPWLRRLSGMTLIHSMAEHGAAAWISSLPVSRASLGLLLAKATGSTTSGGSGRASKKSSSRPSAHQRIAMLDPVSSSLKTCHLSLFAEELTESSADLPGWGSMRNGSAYESTKWAASMSEAVSISSAIALEGTWPTASARDHKGSPLEENIERKDGKSRMDQLDRVAEYWSLPGSSRPDQSRANGSTSSGNSQSSRQLGAGRPKLNPMFVEWLMGWPIGWTGSALAATELCRWRQLSRSAFLRLVR